MSEYIHTPGPWRVRDRFYVAADASDPFALAEVKCCRTVPAEAVQVHVANARLIAAAPTMLADHAFFLAREGRSENEVVRLLVERYGITVDSAQAAYAQNRTM